MLIRLAEPALFAVVILVLWIALAMGFLLGMRRREVQQDRAFSQLNTLQAGLLGLLALLLGFSFNVATTRWESRKQAFIDEANTIGTTYLRTSLLPEAQRKDVVALLAEYVDVRLAPEVMRADRGGRERIAAEARRLQSRIWQLAMDAVAIDARPVTTGLFVSSLNQMIDAHDECVALIEDHVPETVLRLLLAVAVGAMWLTGYAAGLTDVRNLVAGAIVSLLIGFVILLIVDLDRPGRGQIRVSDASLREVRASMTAEP